MTIADTRGKCKELAAKVPRDALVIGILVLASSASFGLGFLAGIDAPVPDIAGVLSAPVPILTEPLSQTVVGAGKFVGSKNGTKYYLPSCSGVERISEANKVWFTSAEAALAAGYAPAANCKGL